MFRLLNQIKQPNDLKRLDRQELPDLAKEIRQFIIQTISKTGGHLASNLGVVELTIALHYLFDSPTDKMIWDVGHQAYVHKLLTGRRIGFKTLRKIDGMSGFPKTKESEHDVFETGHSSTSISAALGMAVARDFKKEKNHVLAIIGDGSLTGGMAFEALNHAARGNTHLIVILNDNEMSISENVGGVSTHLSKLRSAKGYLKAKEEMQDLLQEIPVIGDGILYAMKRTKEGVKSLLNQNNLFEEMGFTYLGPIDGHNFEDLFDILENAKQMEGPILIHVKTKKGKGYTLAEKEPSLYHGVGPFAIEKGVMKTYSKEKTFSDAFGEAVLDLAAQDEKIVAITAAMQEGTGLTPFAKAFPKRFFDVGIAEQHAVTFAAGLAKEGAKPVVAIYSSFLQRAYDQILHDVGLQNLPVVFAIDRAGIVGEDGPTHQGIFDLTYLSTVPGMHILTPKSTEEIKGALAYAFSLNAPCAIRYPKGNTLIQDLFSYETKNQMFDELVEGEELAILAVGTMAEIALKVKQRLEEQGIQVGVVAVQKVWPFNTIEIDALTKKYKKLLTIEDHVLTGGFGMHIASYLKEQESQTVVSTLGYPKGDIEHGKRELLLARYGLEEEQIARRVVKVLKKEGI
jgi:1-deoxy-D-xylulose-5-phosphate synthase